MSFCLQVAGDGDVFPMLAIYAPYVRDTAITFEYEVPTAAEFGARLHHVLPEYPWLVCRAPGQVLGYAYAHRHMERAAYGWNVECSVYVLGSARGRGVGRALYGALLELLRLQGVVNAYGCIAVPNEPSEALHRATGFSLLGHFPASGWKQGRWHDIVWYGRCLQEPGAGEPAPLRPFGCLGQELVDEVLRRHARGWLSGSYGDRAERGRPCRRRLLRLEERRGGRTAVPEASRTVPPGRPATSMVRYYARGRMCCTSGLFLCVPAGRRGRCSCHQNSQTRRAWPPMLCRTPAEPSSPRSTWREL